MTGCQGHAEVASFAPLHWGLHRIRLGNKNGQMKLGHSPLSSVLDCNALVSATCWPQLDSTGSTGKSAMCKVSEAF